MIDRLIENIRRTEAPIVVGLDPQMSFIPEALKDAALREFGPGLDAAAEAVWQFNRKIIDAVWDLIPAVKPQIAMYEQFGLPGLAAFDRTVRYCREKGLVVIGDIKRGDIGSTSAAYAAGHLGATRVFDKDFRAFDEDMVTVNPYLGTDGVQPFLKSCAEFGKGIFILVKTSNPSSGEFQDQYVLTAAPGGDGPSSLFLSGNKDGGAFSAQKLLDLSAENGDILKKLCFRPLYELVGEKVAEWGSDPALIGKYGYSEVGAVVGATYPEMGAVLRRIMPRSYILVPGYGAQGGKGSDLAPFFNEDGLGAIVNSSRGIIAAYTKAPYADTYGPESFADASRAAVLDMKADIASALA